MTVPTDIDSSSISVHGWLTRVPGNSLVRGLLTLSGLLLVRSVAVLFVRYCLGVRGEAEASLSGSLLRIETRWQFWGKPVRSVSFTAPVSELTAARLENRTQYLYSVAGFGALAVGVLLGMQWFLDGLHAGYPYLTAAGALVIAAGAVSDVFLYLFTPRGAGGSRLLLSVGPWILCMRGVDAERARTFADAVEGTWRARERKPEW